MAGLWRPRRPDHHTVPALIGAVPAEQSDEWAEQRRYIGSEILGRCRLHPVEGGPPTSPPQQP
ncbi:hypothetical protein [Kitasatospora sp. NPDC093679]|uniref:hypothetical protein n=1 Tax=Kitasatospora sp. NPDC093679 TaxID=3154983 RepID=UPI00343D5767